MSNLQPFEALELVELAARLLTLRACRAANGYGTFCGVNQLPKQRSSA